LFLPSSLVGNPSLHLQSSLTATNNPLTTSNMSAPAFDSSKMLYRNLGNSGLRVPVLSYGAWQTFGIRDDQKGNPIKARMQKAFELGINMFDNAEGYDAGVAELEMGDAIKTLGWDRRDIIITTKIFFGTKRSEPHNTRGLSRKHLIEGLNASLERLQLDYVDVVFAHRPDVTTPMEETVRAFNWLIENGKAFYWGTSEWTQMQIQQAIEIAKRLNMIAPICDQPQYNMFHRQKFEVEFKPLWEREGYGSTIFSALAGGFLTGKYNDGIPEDSRFHLNPEGASTGRVAFLHSEEGKSQVARVKELTKIAEELGASMTNLALAWCLLHPNVSTIILGATKPEQLEENVKAIEVYKKITPEIKARIHKILANEPTPEPSYGRRGDDGSLI